MQIKHFGVSFEIEKQDNHYYLLKHKEFFV